MTLKPYLALLLSCFVFANNAAAADLPGVTVHKVAGSFEEVRDRVVFALEGRGLVINYTAKIGDMLKRTGKDIGRAQEIYADAELIEFCSASLSRDAMQADVRNIVYCPYSIAVYSLPGDAGNTHIAYRALSPLASGATAKALEAIDKLVAGIARDAMR